MSNQKLGITASELFACNPYRILGVPVDAATSDIQNTYKKLISIAGTKESETYKTSFDFPSLPPFVRDEKTINTAYSKLASNGYRCFAYSDGVFSAALNIDDVMLNLMDITCYDCFLRCYMWLITNDRSFEEPELWVPLCAYIDKMIMSSPADWEKYFDHRFPDEMYADKTNALRSFYTTFCDIILLPIKEMVRGSMKCRTATDILKVAKVDVNEDFPFIEIPQANKPKNGEEPPKLKIAVKDGEEYFDINTGKMVSFESDSDAIIENNEFAAAASSISADAIVGEEIPKEDIIPDEPEEEIAPPPVVESPAFVKPAPTPRAAEKVEPAPTSTVDEIVIPTKRHKVIIPGRESKNVTPVAPAPVEPVKTPAPAVQEIVQEAAQPQTVQEVEKVTDVQPKQVVPQPAVPKSAAKKPYKKTTKGLTSLVDENEEYVSDTSDIMLTEEADEEENLYTDTLIKMLRANRSNNQGMKDVDTKHIFNNGDSLGQAEAPELSMDAINMKKLDKSLLSSPFETAQQKAKGLDPKKAREEKYKNININDMLNPTIGSKLNTEFKPDAIEEFKKQKQKQKSFKHGLWKFIGLITLIVIILLVLFYFGVL